MKPQYTAPVILAFCAWIWQAHDRPLPPPATLTTAAGRHSSVSACEHRLRIFIDKTQGTPFRVSVQPSSPRYSLTDLGRIFPEAVNDAGEVAGYQEYGQPDLTSGTASVRHACLWQKGRLRDLGTFGGRDSEAHGINKRGQVVGWAQTADGDEHAFLWEGGKLKDLGTLGGLESQAYSINADGRVVGAADTSGGFRHAFLWQKGPVSDLGTLSRFPDSEARSVNSRGWVAGSASNQLTGERPVLFKTGAFRGLPTLHGPPSAGGSGFGMQGLAPRNQPPFASMESGRAIAVNSEGDAVGFSLNHATLWKSNGGVLDLGTLHTDEGSAAYAINDKSEIVGGSGNQAVIWRDGTLTDLNALITTADGWALQNAFAINNRGQIVGIGLLRGERHGFLLTP